MLGEYKDDWISKLQTIRHSVVKEVVPYQRLVEYLRELLETQDCPIKKFDVECQYSGRTVIKLCVGDDDQTVGPFRLDDATTGYTPVKVFVSYWTKTEGPINTQRIRPLVDLVIEYLSMSDRRKGMLILDVKRHDIAERVRARIETLRADQQGYAVVFFDLDKFRDVNNQIGHDEGDRALRDIESDINELSQAAPVTGFSDGGDEYELLFETDDEFVILQSLARLRSKVRARGYGTGRIQIDLTAGVSKHDAVSNPSFQELRKAAEDATKMPSSIPGTKGDKKRGTVSFANLKGNTAIVEKSTFESLGIVILRSGILASRPFANQVLNILSNEVFTRLSTIERNDEVDKVDLMEVISRNATWLGLKTTPDFQEHHLIGKPNFDPVVPPVSVSLAIAHGVLRACTKNFTLQRYLGNDELSISIPDVVPNGISVSCGNRSVGTPLSLLADAHLLVGPRIVVDAPGIKGFIPVSIALVIGLSQMLKSPGGNFLPSGLVGGVAVVDDRPKLGGGLPDFWQAALAALASSWASHQQSISKIAIIGDQGTAPETYLRLEGKKPFDEYELATLANLTVPEVKKFFIWAQNNLEQTEDFDGLVRVLHQCALNLKEISVGPAQHRRPPQPTLTRAPSADGLALPTEEGLRCKSAQQAYPAVLDLLRHSTQGAVTLDDASQQMYELLGFKLLILDPSKNPVPDYLFEARESMSKYADDVLLAEESLIGKHFHDDGQFQRFVSHLSGYFEKDDGRSSTRRAVLVVPNQIDNNLPAPPKPLGLMGIWATPRNVDGSPELQFCFVWRTVEALIGLPYSIYASIKFAEMVVEKINKMPHKGARSAFQRVSLGPMRYLALSLHMRIDDYHRRFAKRVVDAATD